MTLVRLARRPALVPVDELLRRLSDLERRIEAGGGAGAPGGGDAGGRAGSRGGREAPRGGAAGASDDARDRAEPPSEAPAAEPPEPARPSALREESPRGTLPIPRPAAPAPAPAPAPPAPAPAPPAPAPALAPAPSPPLRRPGATDTAIVPVPTRAEDDPQLAAFREIVADVHAANPGIASVLEHAALVEASADRLVVGFEPGSFLAAQLNDTRAREAVRDAARGRLGSAVAVDVVSVARESLSGTLAKRASEVMRERIAQAERDVRDHPVVAAAIELLGAELREVRLAPDLATAASWERRGS
jgi:DNA polymerase-3 subunit gamma/tau